MNKAIQEWRNGRSEWDVFNSRGERIATVFNEDELKTVATIDGAEFVRCECIRTDEPRFLVRDESGRGWAAEWHYTDFTADERGRTDDPDDEYRETLGEWLDRSTIGDEYDDSEDVRTIIRIN